MITGYGVSESARHYYGLYKESMEGKTAVVQGWGTVGAATAYYLALSGARVIGITAMNGGMIKEDGFSLSEIADLFMNKAENELRGEDLLSFKEANDGIWDLGAQIFVPAAASRLVSLEQIKRMASKGLEVISCGANVPFADKEIFWGPISMYADKQVGVVPDFIANCGMARTFAYLTHFGAKLEDQAIFKDVSDTIAGHLRRAYKVNPGKTGICESAFQMALEGLL
jgi:glutamate dehydrogenase/leucine dehydrogenase